MKKPIFFIFVLSLSFTITAQEELSSKELRKLKKAIVKLHKDIIASRKQSMI